MAVLLLLVGAAGGGYLGIYRQHAAKVAAQESRYDVESDIAALDQSKLYDARAGLDPAVQAALDKAAAEAKDQAAKAKKANELAERAQAASRSENREPPDYGPIPSSCDDYTGNRAIGCAELLKKGFGLDQMPCLNKLWNKESNWRTTAENTSSGAYGIPQALPGSKMASEGDDWRTNPATQIKWGLGYIKGRYGTPCKAWDHSVATGWY
ncbi:lytic transglycosylase domain-containing protein [Luedemannella flava]|uniref:aggregation-promoting factor C-terminal-like domain-containing protein n=1 Tax=Luedemannella flava TaxID=349316 RepID=UPI0031E15E96